MKASSAGNTQCATVSMTSFLNAVFGFFATLGVLGMQLRVTNMYRKCRKINVQILKCHVIPSSQIEGTKKLLNKDLGELISKMRLAQQNAVTSLKEECTRQMLAAAHTLALDSKNLLDAVDQARVRANLAKPRRISQDKEEEEEQEHCDA